MKTRLAAFLFSFGWWACGGSCWCSKSKEDAKKDWKDAACAQPACFYILHVGCFHLVGPVCLAPDKYYTLEMIAREAKSFKEKRKGRGWHVRERGKQEIYYLLNVGLFFLVSFTLVSLMFFLPLVLWKRYDISVSTLQDLTVFWEARLKHIFNLEYLNQILWQYLTHNILNNVSIFHLF